MARTADYYFDYVSPFSYLADTRLAAIAERTGATFVYKPSLLGALQKAAGNTPPINVPAKGKHLFVDLQRWAKRYGVPLALNPHFPVNTIACLRAALVAQDEGGFEKCHERLFRAVWVDGKNVAEPEVLREVLDQAGLDGGHILERTGEQPIKDKLRANTDEAVARGAFGHPTFFVGDEMFFGNDRLDFLEEALRGDSDS